MNKIFYCKGMLSTIEDGSWGILVACEDSEKLSNYLRVTFRGKDFRNGYQDDGGSFALYENDVHVIDQDIKLSVLKFAKEFLDYELVAVDGRINGKPETTEYHLLKAIKREYPSCFKKIWKEEIGEDE